MKKLISILLMIIFVLSVLPGISLFAATDELLQNPGFEEGDKAYGQYGACEYEVGTAYARTGEKGLLIKNRTSQYGTVSQSIANILTLNGPGKYRATMWVKLEAPSDTPITCQLTMLVYSREFEKAKYFGSGQKKLTTEWQQFTFEGNINFDVVKGFEDARIYQQSYGAGGVAPNVLVDDISLVKIDEVNGIPLDQVEGGAQPDTGDIKKGTNMLLNPGFEEGDETDWDPHGAGEVTISKEYAYSGEYGMLVTGRTNDQGHSQNLEDCLTLYGPGSYKAYVWAKLPEGSTETNATGHLRVVFRRKDGTGTQYKSSAKKKLTTEWQQFALNAEMDFEAGAGFEEAYICFYTSGRPDIILDEFSLVKTSEVSGVDPSKVQKDDFPDYEMKNINIYASERNKETTFGAIRWDAWFSHNGRSDSIVTQVEKTLSPAEYHFRAPFFANITDEGKIETPAKYSQEIFDQEMLYAKEGGIDYFAYLWYDGEMSEARKLHPTSQYKDDVKMCIMLDGNGIGKSRAREEILGYLNSSFYFKVLDGRPLMYYYINTGSKNANLAAAQNEIKYYRAKCEELGIPAPYAVVMNVSGPETTKIYGDAVSRYSVGGNSSQTFNDYITGVQNGWSKFNTGTVQYVPYLSFGWHAEPRFKNPVSWMKAEENSWVPYPTDEEMYNHISYALSYMDHPSVELLTKINTVIFYAWNEHDEGSWLCPTIAVDENGNQLYNEDGTKKINDSRIKILRQAIDDFKAGKRVEVIINGVSNLSTKTPKPTNPTNNNTENNNNSLFLIIGISAGVIVLAGGAVVTLVVIKKKNKKQENTEE